MSDVAELTWCRVAVSAGIGGAALKLRLSKLDGFS
jgi:hypothetical protein